MKNTEKWIINEITLPEHPKGLSGDDLIEVVYLNGGSEMGLAKTWQSAWNSSSPYSFTIERYRILMKANVLSQFFSFISDNQNDMLVVAAASIIIGSIAVSLFLALFYLIINVSGWFVLMFPAIPIAYLIHRFRTE